MKYLLVDPDFPIPPKSKNHKDFLPIGLLKLTGLLELRGHKVKIVRGNIYLKNKFVPDEIWITSLFTYWIRYVKESVFYYRDQFPNAKIVVGGIAATLFGKEKTKKLTGCDEVILGVVNEAERLPTKKLQEVYRNHVPEVDFQILHAQRGCIRRCPFCGTWRIEPEFIEEDTIKDKIFMKKIVFYDNNFLANQHIDKILDELIELKKQRKIEWCESQSGFDGRLLVKKPSLALKLKKAGFRNVRIAWDWGFNHSKEIKKQIDVLINAGYKSKEIFIFMLYNWNISFDEMERKRVQCFEWEVQISDCRYRPLDQEFDNYNPRITGQTNEDYYIHEEKGWTDVLVKQFRKNVRRQNICIRYGLDFHSKVLERSHNYKEIKTLLKNAKNNGERKQILDKNKINYWDPKIPMKASEIRKNVKYLQTSLKSFVES